LFESAQGRARMTMNNAMRGLTALAFACGCAAARGAETATELAPVQVTASRSEQALTEVPQAVSVVDSAGIARQSPQILGDLLRGQPGVFLQSSGPGQGIAIVRGLKGSEVLHLVDG